MRSSGTRADADADVVARLAALRASLQAGTAARPEFRAALRARLVAEAAHRRGPVPAGAPAPVRAGRPQRPELARRLHHLLDLPASRRTAALTGAAAVLVLVGGLAVAADRSYPGDPFYDVKRGRQAVELRLAPGSDVERGLRHLLLATERLHEMQVVSRRGAAAAAAPTTAPTATGASGPRDALVDVLAEHDDRVRVGGELVLRGSREAGGSEPLRVLMRWSDAQSAGLAGLAPDLSEAARHRVGTSLQVLAALRASATGMLPPEECRSGCAPLPGTPAPAPSGPSGGTALGRVA